MVPVARVTTPSEQSGSPLKRTNAEPASAVAVSVTMVPCAKLAAHVPVVQVMPGTSLVISPDPNPSRSTVRTTDCDDTSPVTIIGVAWDTGIISSCGPMTSTRVTDDSAQVSPHAFPAPALVTVWLVASVEPINVLLAVLVWLSVLICPARVESR